MLELQDPSLREGSTLIDLLRGQAAERGRQTLYTFLADGEEEAGGLTFGELDERARALGAVLAGAGLRGERALLLFPPGLDFIVAFFGCLYGGVVAVPAYPPRARRDDSRLREIVQDCRPRAVLTTAALRARLAGREEGAALADALWIATEEIALARAGEWRDPEPDADSLAFLQYTSGSTSSPKGVMVTHGNLLHNERLIRRAFRQGLGSVVVSWLPLYHDMGLIGGVLQPLYSGSRCVLMSPAAFLQSPVRWLRAISHYRATTSGGPDFAYELCVRRVRPEQREELDLASWEVAFNGAEPVRAATLERFAAAFAPCSFRREAFVPCYGLAEATLLVTAGAGGPNVMEVGGRRLVGCGVPQQEVRIADPETGALCDEGEEGEIRVAGPSVAAGYWDRPEETAETFGDFLRTGDLGVLLGGELFVTGRIKDLIILRGRNLYPQDLELTAERAHPALRPGGGAAFSVEVGDAERLVIVHEVERRADFEGEAVAEAVRRAVAEEHEARVEEIVLIAAGTLPRTSSGKVRRRATRAAWLEGALETVFAETRTAARQLPEIDEEAPLESRLRGAIAAIAGEGAWEIGRDRPLTGIGLDSLGCVEVANRIESVTGVAVSPADLLRGASLADLAAAISGETPEGISAAAVRSPDGLESASFGQRALWFLDQLQPDSAAYVLAGAVTLRGPLDAGALARALAEVVRRHEALRTTFVVVDGEPVQRIGPPWSPTLPVADLAELPEALRTGEAARLAVEEGRRGFDLAAAPLLRATLLRLGTEEHRLLLAVHHIVADGWSIDLLGRELGALYAAFAAGQPSPLPEPPAQYADFVHWQQSRLAGGALEELLDWWRERLDHLEPLELPADRSRSAVPLDRGGRAGRSTLRLPASALRALGAAREATPFMALLAVFQALLARVTHRRDLAVGSPVANRPRADFEGVIGFFVNTLVLRTGLGGSPSFLDLLERVREVALAAFAHQDLPFERLAAELGAERDRAGRTELVRVLFALQREPLRLPMPGIETLAEELETGTAKFDLSLSCVEEGEAFVCTFEYDAGLFEEVTIRRLGGHLENLVEAVATRPEAEVFEIGLLSEAERQQIWVEWGQGLELFGAAPTILDLFAARVRGAPEAEAISFGEHRLSYAALDERSDRVARRLVALGIRPGTVVGLHAERSLELGVALLGIWKAGGIFLPLDPGLPAERLAYLLEDSGAEVVLTAAPEALPDRKGVLRVPLEGDGAGGLPRRPRAGDLAYILYTSGTTGRPKGVMVEHGSLVHTITSMVGLLDLNSGDRLPSIAPFSFDVFLFELLAPLAMGGSVALVPLRPALDIDLLLREVACSTRFHAVPAVMRQVVDRVLAEGATERFAGLREVYAGGDAVPPELIEDARRAFPAARPGVLYGPTEATIFATRHVGPEPGPGRPVRFLGRPLPGFAVRLLDPQGLPVPAGVPGEVYLGSRAVARGYLGRPGLTAEKFVPALDGERLYRTGDLARWLPDGELEFLGRVDHQVKIRGVRIEPGEIEAALAALPGIQQAVVLATEGSDRSDRSDRSVGSSSDRRLVAYVVGDVPVAELRRSLRERLPEAMVPAAFVPVAELPLSPNGKVDRKALAAWPLPEEATAAEPTASNMPRDPIEDLLAGLFADLLGRESVGVHDSFFDLGGHSLLATRAMSRIRQALGVELSLQEMFAAPTVAGLARAVRGARQASAPPIVPRPHVMGEPLGERLPLSFAQQRLWFFWRLAPESPFYNMPAALRLEGALDERVLARTFDEIVRRHEALRTRFPAEGGRSVQVIDPPRPHLLPVVDLRDVPEEARRAEADRLTVAEARRPFDLAAEPLFRTTLLRLGDDERLLLVDMHHVVSDGWSVGVLYRELAALLPAFAAGRPSPLPELPVQYADFALWQREWLRGEVLESELAYWRERLADLPATELPADRPRPATPVFRGATLSEPLPPELVAGLRALARRSGGTLFLALLAGFAALLQRYAVGDDLVIGAPVANRDRVEVEGLVGFFVNTLVLRLDLGGRPDFRVAMARAREVSVGAWAHQAVPFERLVEELAPERDASGQPFFRVMFQLVEVPPARLDLGGLSLERLDIERGTTTFDLALDLVEQPAGIEIQAVHSTDLFDTATIRRLVAHFTALLSAAAADPGRPVAELPLLTGPERRQLLDAGTGPEGPEGGELVHEAFAARAAFAPEAVALVVDGRGELAVTYGELARRVWRLAQHLRGLGIGPEVAVGVALERSPEMIVGLLGVLAAGGVYLPLDPAFPEERLHFLCADAGAAAVITTRGLASRFPGVHPVLIEEIHKNPPPDLPHSLPPALPGGEAPPPSRTDPATLEEASRGAEFGIDAFRAGVPPPLGGGAVGSGGGEGGGFFRVPADALAYLIYTSGSTGVPKGVGVSHRAIAAHVRAVVSAYELSADDCDLQFASASFDVSLEQILPTLAVGARLVLRTDLWEPGELLRRLGDLSLTRANLPTAYWSQLAREALRLPLPPKALGLVLAGGEAMRSEPLRQWARGPLAGVRLLNAYGPTETTITATAADLTGRGPNPSGNVSIGRALAGRTLYVLDASGEVVPLGVPGELCIGGGLLARGYLGRPELTAERFVPDPFAAVPGSRLYRTGDRVRLLADGELEFLGRVDEQVKIRGFRIEPGEVEAVLASHPVVREAVVVARESPRDEGSADPRLVAYVTLDERALSPAGLPERLEAEQVAEWRAVYDDDVYVEPADPTFNIGGWNSSYTRGPIPEEEMREWLDGTVGRILARRPRRVLEIGCGSGLVLFRVAPGCERYLGTDFSRVSLDYVSGVLDRLGGIPGVELRRAEADDFGAVGEERFDAVVLNSVVQYFPSASYLLEVLAGAVARVEPGGFVFVGDVRSLPLLPAFHASVERSQAPSWLPEEKLARRVEAAVAADPELVLDPAFFVALRRRLPRVTHVEIQLRRGWRENEMSRFRYDVVLHVERAAPEEPAWIDAGAAPSLAALRERLVSNAPEVLGVRGIPNARVSSPPGPLSHLPPVPRRERGREATAPIWVSPSPGDRGAGRWERGLGGEDITRPTPIHPEDLWALAAQLGYEAGVTWSADPGKVDVVFRRRRSGEEGEPLPGLAPVVGPDVEIERLANRPLRSKAARALVPRLREHVAERLPEFMVPVIVVLEELPINSRGKVDRRALPEPEDLQREEGFVAPRTPEERALAEVWSELLGIGRVGANDNFFALGGHSLLATQVVARIRQTFAVDLELRHLFEEPTLAGLAGRLRRALAEAGRLELPPIEPVPRDLRLPLSFGQQRLWFLDRMEPGRPGYLMAGAFRLTGALDIPALASSLGEIVRRHEALRTTFQEEGGEPWQAVQPPRPVALPVVDLSGVSGEDEARRLARAEAARPFDLARDPMLRATLLRLGAGRHVALVTLHHIASDGWSIDIVARELAALYAAVREERQSPLPELPIQYGDYAVWQRRFLDGPVLAGQLAAWRRRLAGVPAALDLPTDHPRPPVRTTRAGRRTFAVSSQVGERLRRLATREGTTLYTFLLAAFAALLSRLSHQEDLTVGTPVAGRRQAETEGLIGFFVNTLVMRAGLAGDPPFLALLARMQETVLDAFVHQDLPFERLVEELQPERSLARTPLFQVMFSFQHARSALALPGVTLEPLPFAPEARFDLELTLAEAPEGLQGTLDFALDLFDPTTAERWAESLGVLLEGAAARPETRLADLPLLAPEQSRQLAEWGEGTQVLPTGPTVLDLFAAQAARIPDAVALVAGDEILTYAGLERQAEGLAMRLRERGAGPGSVVGLRTERTAELVVGLLGILRSGAAYLPLDPAYPAERLAFQIADAGAELIVPLGEDSFPGGPPFPRQANLSTRHPEGSLSDPKDLGGGGGAEFTFPAPRSFASQDSAQDDGSRRWGEEGRQDGGFGGPASRDLAYLIYTSGTTGLPKGVEVEHGSLAFTLGTLAGTLGFGSGDRMPAIAPFSFDIFLFELFAPLLTGGTSVLLPLRPTLDLDLLLGELAASTCFHAVPAVLRQVVDRVLSEGEARKSGPVPRESSPPGPLSHLPSPQSPGEGEKGTAANPGLPLSRRGEGGRWERGAGGEDSVCRWAGLREIYTGGDTVPDELLADLRRAFPSARLRILYGPTEGTIVATSHPVPEEPAPRPLLGRPLAGVSVHLLDPAGRPVPPGVTGEIHLGGPGVTRGYRGRPELTAERYVPAPDGGRLYRTGDLARWLPDGWLEFLGRTDGQLKIRGFRVEPGEIEARLAAHPRVRQAAVVTRGPAGGRRLAAFYVPDGAALDPGELRGFLAETLPEHMIPGEIVSLAELPLTPNGKVDRRGLAARPEERSTVSTEAPRTPAEEILAGLWAEMLDRPEVGIHDDFFALGGHSLLATRLVSRVRDAFHVELPVKALFEAPTVAALARRIEEASRAARPPLVRQPCGAEIPLSFAQQRLWFLDQMEPGSPLYNIPAVLRLAGPLDAAVLERALGEVVRRHEALRTAFPATGGLPRQEILPVQAFRLPVVDLGGLPPDRAEAEALRRGREESRRPFELATGPVMRALLLRLAPDGHGLALTLHHIVSDGWSVGVMIRELAALYEAFAAVRPSPLPELPVQYADFAVWQRSWLAGEALEEQLAAWRARLAGVPSALELPTDRPRPPVRSIRGAELPVTVPAELRDALVRLGRRERATLFMVLLAAFEALLHRWTGQTDLTVGSPVAGRTRSETEGLIGFFVNTLVMRSRVSTAAGNPGFRRHLASARDTALDAWAHQDLPFERLVEELEPRRDPSRTPLFQALLALVDAPALPSLPSTGEGTVVPPPLGGRVVGSGGGQEGGSSLPGLSLSPVPVSSETAKFDLSLSFAEGHGELAGTLEYAADLFDRTTVLRLAGHFESLLAAVIREPDAALADLPLLAAAERHQVTREWGCDTERDYPRALTIHELFATQARSAPDRTALTFEGTCLSYGELNRRANRLAQGLRRRGVGPEVPVGLLMERSADLVVALLAILKAGGAYVPLDPSYPEERLAFLREDCGARLVLTVADLAEIAAGESDEDPAPSALPESLAYVVYTSGSTGRPKGVEAIHRAVVRLAWRPGYVPVVPGDRLSQISTVSFDAATFEIWGALLNGAELAIFPPQPASLEELGERIEREGVSVLWMTTGLFHQMVDGPVARLGSVLWLVSGGESISAAHVRKLLAAHPSCTFVQAYGPTENTTFTTCHPVPAAERARHPLPIGRPIEGSTIHLLDRELRPVPAGVAGELYTGGDGLARGYLRRPERTAESFVPDPLGPLGARLYRTGDLARWLPDGTIEFLGRFDHQVKIRGFRVELGEIEAAAVRHSSVLQAVALVHVERGDKRIVLWAVPEPGASRDSVALRAFLQSALPGFMVPAAIGWLAALPVTPQGKADRRALAALEVVHELSAGRPPRTPVEERLAAIWSDVLGREGIGIDDDFFELGGHSLLATQVASRVREELEAELPLKEVFARPRLADLADWIEEERRRGAGLAAPPVVPVPHPAEGLPLSFAQEWMWVVDQLDPGSGAYNAPIPLRLTGDLDAAALERALAEVVRRHEILRTAFVAGSAGPVQVPFPPASLPFATADLSELPLDRREAEATRLAFLEARRPFDLAAGRPLRTLLLRLAADDHRLVINLHHIVTDGWSAGVLLREAAELYEAFRAGGGPTLSELPVQYADFAVWQRTWLTGEVLESLLSWWRERLAGDLPVLELPADRPRGAVPSLLGERLPFALDRELSTALIALGRRQGATLFATLLAVFDTLLARYSQQDDLLVGTPVANRTRRETEGLIGYFVNNLVLRTDLAGDPLFSVLIKRVQETALGAWSHQDLPLLRLVQELHPDRAGIGGAMPLFQAWFQLQNAPLPSIELPGLALEPWDIEVPAATFDLELLLRETEDGLQGHLVFDPGRFHHATAEGMLRHFLALAAAVAEDPDRRLSDLPMLSGEERHQLLHGWNPTETRAGDTPLHLTFAARAAEAPEASAVTFEGETLTYGELQHRAGLLAGRLQALGVGPESRVGLAMERSADLVVAILGILRAGGAYVPLDPDYPRERLELLLGDSGVSVLVTQEELLARLPITEIPAVCVDRSPHPPGPPLPPPHTPSPGEGGMNSRVAWRRPSPGEVGRGGGRGDGGEGSDHLAYVIYTSGSTGQPKGVMVTHRQAARLFEASGSFCFGPGDVWTLFHSYAFDFSVWELWGALLFGGRLVVVPRWVARSPEAFRDLLAREQVTVLNQTPSAFYPLVQEDKRAAGGLALRWVVFGGEALEPRKLRPWFDRHGDRDPVLVNMYGITETTVHVTHRSLNAADADGGASVIGGPLLDLRLYLAGRHFEPAPFGVAGEILVGGGGVARGYLGRPELTAARFVPDLFSGEPGARLYRSGDLARRRPDGELEYLGRADQQLKVRGFRIEPGEIEAALVRHPAIAEAVVIARAHGTGDVRLVAFLVSKPGEEVPAAGELRDFLLEGLPEHMVPSAFVPLPALLLTAHGKVDRRSLVQIEETPERAAVAAGAPLTPFEEALAALWAGLLEVDAVGRDESFFALGGHSLLMTRVASRVREALGVSLPMKSFFDRPTVGGMAASLVEEMGKKVGERRLEELLAEVEALPEERVRGLVEEKRGAVGVLAATSPSLPGPLSHPLPSTGRGGSQSGSAGAPLSRPGGGDGRGEGGEGPLTTRPDLRLGEILAVMAGPETDPGLRITSIGFPTCNRPDVLERGISSYAESARHRRFVVMDDSRDSAVRDEYRRRLADLRQRLGVEIVYAGLEEKRRFGEALAAEGIPLEVARIALLDPVGIGLTVGANRNALLLQTVGEGVLSVDDDTLSRVAPPPRWQDGVAFLSGTSPGTAFLSGRDPGDIEAFPGRAEALGSLPLMPHDLASLHESALGRPIRAWLAGLGADSPAALDAGDPRFLRRLAEGGRVRITTNGWVGDCGWHSPTFYMLLTGESRRRLLRSAEAYTRGTASKEIIRSVPRPTVGNGDSFMATLFTGLDNRELLPPFPPVLWGEDLLFGITLQLCFGDARVGHLPWVAAHEPLEFRAFWSGEMMRSASGVDHSRLVSALLDGFTPDPHAAPEAELRRLGEWLTGLGRMEPAAFDDLARRHVVARATAFAADLEHRLETLEDDSPAADLWKTDVRRYLDLLCRHTAEPEIAVPLDLLYGRSVDEARRLAQTLLLHHGLLLAHWPDLVEAARRLKARGQALAEEIR